MKKLQVIGILSSVCLILDSIKADTLDLLKTWEAQAKSEQAFEKEKLDTIEEENREEFSSLDSQAGQINQDEKEESLQAKKIYQNILQKQSGAKSSGNTEDLIIQSIPDLTVENVGILSLEEGGLPEKIWLKSDYDSFYQLMQDLPESYHYKALQQLYLKLLTSSYEIPRTGREEYGADQNSLNLRVQKLFDAKYIGEALNLAQTHRPSISKDLFNKIYFEYFVQEGDWQKAWFIAQQGLDENFSLYWERAVILCLLSQGQENKVTLSLEIYKENHPKDQDFLSFVKAIESQEERKQLDFEKLRLPFIAQLAKAHPLTLEEVQQFPDPIKKAVYHKKETIPLTAQAVYYLTEYMVQEEAVSPLTLDILYSQLEDKKNINFLLEALAIEDTKPLSQEHIFNRILYNVRKNIPSIRAWLVNRLKETSDPLKKQQYMDLLIRNAWYNKLLNAVSPLIHSHLVDSIERNPHKDYLESFFLAQVFQGRLEEALPQAAALLNKKTSSGLGLHLVPLAILFQKNTPRRHVNDKLKEWYVQLSKVNSKKANVQAQKVFSVLSALGVPIQEQTWNLINSSYEFQVADMGMLSNLSQALEQNKIGEVLARLLILFKDQKMVDPKALQDIFTGLGKSGQQTLQKQLIREILLDPTSY